MPNQSPESEQKNEKRKKAHEVLKYSGMAFEMAIIMGFFVFGGSKLDGYFQNEKTYLTILGAIIGTIVALTYTLRDFIKSEK